MRKANENRPDYADFKAPAKFQAIESIIARRLIEHPNAIASYSGGSDSDVMIDLIERVRKTFALPPVRYVFINTGLEMRATKEHVKEIAEKYGIEIETHRPKISIVTAVRKYGLPFMSKLTSEGIENIQVKNLPLRLGIEFEKATDKKAMREKLRSEYPKSETAINYLCSCNSLGEVKLSQISMGSNAYLLDFMIENPPTFKISNRCCKCCKKEVAHKVEKGHEMIITGERYAEGGARSVGTSVGCFSEKANGQYKLKPIYYVTDDDKAWYKKHYGLRYSDAYEIYGFKRTGCCGCPISYKATDDLERLRPYEPNLVKAAWAVFGDSYRYRAAYNEYRHKKQKEARGKGQITIADFEL